MQKEISIVGLGVNGLALALVLQKHGVCAHIYESADEPRVTGTGIYIWPQGFSVLAKLVDKDELCKISNEITHLSTLDKQAKHIHSKPHDQASVDGTTSAYMFHRKDLFNLLLSKLDQKQIHLNKKCNDIRQDNDQVVVTFSDGTQVSTDIVIATDGVYSKVRQCLFPELRYKATNISVSRGMVYYSIPDADPAHCNIYSGDYSRIVTYLVNQKTQYRYWFAAYKDVDQKPLSKDKLLERFSKYDRCLYEMIQQTPEDQIVSSHLYEVPVEKTWCSGNVILLGDSAHAILPTLGYGFSLGLENDYTLALSLIHHNFNTEQAFKHYEQLVLERTREISHISHEFTELFYMQPPKSVEKKTLQGLYGSFFKQIKSIPYGDLNLSRSYICKKI